MRPFARLLSVSLLLALVACDRTAPPVASAVEPATASGDTPSPAAPARAAAAPTDGKLRLAGTFEVAGTRWGEAWTSLYFDDVALAMENERVIRVDGRGTPAIDSAIDAIASINVETASPEGKRLIEACGGGCTLEATIMEESRGEWMLDTLRSATSSSQPPPLNVAKHDARRKPLLDALRPIVERDLGQKVIFEVETLRERDGSAFAIVHPRTPQGASIDFLKTRHAERQREGLLDGDGVIALLQRRDGAWVVRDFVVGPTDVAWATWAQDYGAPEAIFFDHAP